jgi:NAD(P)-dependent dehydrogenase (short-subunit alcohol dehydrogenase family)
MITSFEGKVAVVTGGASGIGLALARKLLAEDMRVVISDISPEALERAAAALGSHPHLYPLCSDASCASDVAALAARVVRTLGSVHLVCLNAGLLRLNCLRDTSIEEWTLQRAAMLDGVFYGIKAFLPHLDASAEAHLLITSSVWGYFFDPLAGAYCAAKAGATALAEVLDAELRREGSRVGVSCVVPGFVSTGIATGAAPSSDPAVVEIIARLRLGVTPDAVAAAALRAVRAGAFAVPVNIEAPDWQRMDERIGRLRHGASCTDIYKGDAQ